MRVLRLIAPAGVGLLGLCLGCSFARTYHPESHKTETVCLGSALLVVGLNMMDESPLASGSGAAPGRASALDAARSL
jgi:hypothetical protein